MYEVQAVKGVQDRLDMSKETIQTRTKVNLSPRVVEINE